jgi:hypothetical protein
VLKKSLRSPTVLQQDKPITIADLVLTLVTCLLSFETGLAGMVPRVPAAFPAPVPSPLAVHTRTRHTETTVLGKPPSSLASYFAVGRSHGVNAALLP